MLTNVDLKGTQSARADLTVIAATVPPAHPGWKTFGAWFKAPFVFTLSAPDATRPGLLQAYNQSGIVAALPAVAQVSVFGVAVRPGWALVSEQRSKVGADDRVADADEIALATEEGLCRFSPSTGERYSGRIYRTTAVCYSPDGIAMAVGTSDGRVIVSQVSERDKVVRETKLPGKVVTSLALTARRDFVLASCRDGSCFEIDVLGGDVQCLCEGGIDGWVKQVFVHNTAPVAALVGDHVRVINTETKSAMRFDHGSEEFVYGGTFLDGDRLCLFSASGMSLWTILPRERLLAYKPEKGVIVAVQQTANLLLTVVG